MTQVNVTGASYSGFEEVKALRLGLEALIQRQRSIIRELALEATTDRWEAELEFLAERVRSDTFKVLVLGQFNRGKSTFINALIGQNVLPSYATPTTAVINEIKYGDEPRILLYPRAADGDGEDEPVEVGVDELKDYVVVKSDRADEPNPYARAAVYWPLELCRSGVELIDSPGLNEDPIREKQTIGYLARADAVVMMLDALQPATTTELEFFNNTIRPMGHDDMFWVFNRINQVDEDERDDVEDWGRRVLKPYVEYEGRVFFIDAKGGLKGRVSGDEHTLLASNLPAVERNLQRFLALQRGRNKVLLPAHQLQRSVRSVDDAITGRRELLERNRQELREAYERNRAPLDRLHGRVDLLARNVSHEFTDVTRSVDIVTRDFLAELTTQIPKFTTEAEITNPTQIVRPHKLMATAKEIGAEVAHSVTGALQRECATWINNDLMRHLNIELQTVQQDIREDVHDFENDLRAVRLDLSLTGKKAELGDAQAMHPVEVGSMLKPRVGAEFVGQQVLGGALSGVVFGVGGAFAVGVAASVVSVASVLLLPVVILAALTGAVTGVVGLGDRKTLGDIVKRRLVKSLTDEWNHQRDPIREKIVAQTKAQLDGLLKQFSDDLNSQVSLVQDQVDSALRDKNQGEGEVARQKELIERLASELSGIETELDTVIEQAISLGATSGGEAFAQLP